MSGASMVKADYTRDYYADLELSPNCTTDDIRRQFRKLALLYHPDRNPGKELEYNPRFQAIQAANEVLGDPDQRAKYDASRRRGTVNNTFARPAPPRRANPYQATSNFPPPPRRTANNKPAPAPAPSPTAKGGAERYAQWARPPPRPKANQPQDAREKANAFSAWQAMNSAQKGQAKPPPPPPPFPPRRPVPTPPEATGGPPGSSRPRNASPLRSAYEEVHGQPHSSGPFQTTSAHAQRRPGFDPTSPVGDERPAAGATMYSTSSRYDHGYPQAPPRAPSPPPRGSAPTAKKAERPGNYRTTSREDAPFVEGSKVKTPYPTNVGEKTYINPEMRRVNSFRDRPPNWQPGSSNLRPQSERVPPEYERRRSTGAGIPEGQTNEYFAHRQHETKERNKPFMYYSDDEDAPPQPKNGTSSGGTASSDSGDSNVDAGPPRDRPKARYTPRMKTDFNMRSFDFQPKTQEPGAPRSESSFARTSNPELRGHQPDLEDANPSPTDAGGSSSLPRTESHPNMFAYKNQIEDPPSNPQPFREKTFPADKWSRDIQEENWASKWATSTSGPQGSSPTMKRSRGSGSRISTRNNTAKTPVTPQPASVEEEENGDPKFFTGAQRADSPDSNDAMDIDTETPPADRRPSIVLDDTTDPTQQQPRAVHVETSRPEWRDNGGTNGEAYRRPSLPGNFSLSSDGQPPKPAPAPKLSTQLSMDDFRYVTPFAKPPPSGLRDMSELAEDLPFPSRAATKNPFASNEGARTEPPKPPKPPLPPEKCNSSNWPFYVEHLYNYLSKWHDYNNRMIEHFRNRSAELEDFEKNVNSGGSPTKYNGGGVVHGWLAARGDTRELKGWDTYVAWMEQDKRWRAHWNLACEKHVEAIEAHSNLRERIRAGEMAT